MTQYTIDQIIDQLTTSHLDDLWVHGIRQLKSCIHDYFLNIENWSLQDIENETVLIEVFKHAYLDNDNKIIIRASSNYHGCEAFSDVCIEMDESEQNDYLTDGGLCYAKVYIN
ncbi:3416_t:CDS:1 [Racocetra fulgida]|uniref:3416_t:CDS:1 n=1 Tax=Racocetra fulgida TaxID=60492 RepID=A0A9N9FAD1_9GLOM|nr:3416_t:CDS:1 [Racocetra fulgida]